MSHKSIFDRIQRYNQGRDPERLAMKLQAMQTSPFVFLRGTCHLFYENLPRDALLKKAPITWICGDLHLENFGTYKGDNHLVYFDMNDFDEASLSPCTWELLRFLVSVIFGTKALKLKPTEVITLCHSFLDTYSTVLQRGKAKWIERETAEGMVKELLVSLGTRRRKIYLAKRTRVHDGVRRIHIDGKRTLSIDLHNRHKIEASMKAFASQQAEPKFFKMLDVARRIAGLASLGVERYVILIEGKGSPDANYLLDLKEALPSSLEPRLRVKQPKWKTEAERIVAIQQRMQAVSPAFQHAVVIGKRSYVLRALQPSEDRVNLNLWHGQLSRLEGVMVAMGQVVAWGQLRSSGRQGSSIADELIEFGFKTRWRKVLIDMAVHYSERIENDWQEYRETTQREIGKVKES